MDFNSNVSLSFDASEWLADLMSSSSPRQRQPFALSTSPATHSVLDPLFVPLASTQKASQNEQHNSFYVPNPQLENSVQSHISPLSMVKPPDATSRRSKKGRSTTDPSKQRIPRPPNAFMLFRSWMLKNSRIPHDVECRQQNLSKLAGRYWSLLKEDEKNIWKDRAQSVREDHYRRYKSSPTARSASRAGKAKKMAEEFGVEIVDEATRIQRLVEMYYPELKGRDVVPPQRHIRTKRRESAHNIDSESVLSRSYSPYSIPSTTSSSAPSPAPYVSSAISRASLPANPRASFPISTDINATSFPPSLAAQFPFFASSSATMNDLLVSGNPNGFDASLFEGQNIAPTTYNFQMSYAPVSTNPLPPGPCSFEASTLLLPYDLYQNTSDI